MVAASYLSPAIPWISQPSGARAASSLQSELPPRSVLGRVLANRYLPEELIEQRSFSVCYRAYDLGSNENVQVEFLPRRAIACWSLVRQAVDKLAALGHPRIVEVVGRGMLAGAWPFIVTEASAAPSLRERLAEAGPLALGHALSIGLACANALGAAHGAGVIHGSFAPGRVLLPDPAEASAALKVGGFGFASLLRGAQGDLLGSPELGPYLSPEHVRGAALDARSDVYALGAVLHELVTGAPPFTANAASAPGQRISDATQVPRQGCGSRDLSRRALDKIIARCLAQLPARRYPDAAALAVDLGRLEAALARAPGAAPAPTEAPAARALRLLPAHYPPARSRVDLGLPKVIINRR